MRQNLKTKFISHLHSLFHFKLGLQRKTKKREKAKRAILRISNIHLCNLPVYSENSVPRRKCGYLIDSEPQKFLYVIFFIVCLNLYCFFSVFDYYFLCRTTITILPNFNRQKINSRSSERHFSSKPIKP